MIFNVDGHVKLHIQGPPDDWYFQITGFLTDVNHRVGKNTKFETVFPFDPTIAPGIIATWPPQQGCPFDGPPVDGAHTERLGFSKTNFVFSDDDSIVTVGPSIPKLALLQDSAAQLTVASVGVITDGTGKYEGGRGLGAFNGRAFFEQAPSFVDPPSGLQQLIDGFPLKVAVSIQVIQKGHLRP